MSLPHYGSSYYNKFEGMLLSSSSIDSDPKALLQLSIVHVGRGPNRFIGIDACRYSGQFGPYTIARVRSEWDAYPFLAVHQTLRETRPRDDLVHTLRRLAGVPDLATGDASGMKTINQGISLLGRRICARRVPMIRGIADRLARPEEIGPEVARRDDVHAHAKGCELPRERLRERVERGLGAIVRAERRHAGEARGGADVQDVAGTLRAECGEERLDDRDWPEQVRLELSVDISGPVQCPQQQLFWFAQHKITRIKVGENRLTGALLRSRIGRSLRCSRGRRFARKSPGLLWPRVSPRLRGRWDRVCTPWPHSATREFWQHRVRQQ